MKRKSTLMLLCVAMCFMAQAKIWRVNNNTGVQADFTTLQAAHDGASTGDTLHVEGSPTSYGGATITKKLIILGPGYYLAENPNTQAWPQTAWIGHITYRPGSEGSVITGLDFRSSGVTIQSNDIVIRKNNFSSPNGAIPDWSVGAIGLHTVANTSTPVTNIIISQNYGLRIDVNYPSTGVLIAGNFLSYYAYNGEETTGQNLVAHADAILLVQNNIFRRGRITTYNSNFTNNIMVAGFFDSTNNLFANNLANGTQFGTINSNKQNVDMSTVFVGAGTDISTDGQWKLKAGSPALGAGYGSTASKKIDAGMYSGNTPYVLSGMPSMPAIYFFENQPVGSSSDPIDVSIKVRSAGN